MIIDNFEDPSWFDFLASVMLENIPVLSCTHRPLILHLVMEKQWMEENIKIPPAEDFSGGPAVKTPCSHCRGPGSDPCSRKEDPTCQAERQKKKNQKQQSLLFLSCYSYKSRRMQEVAKGINKLSREIKISWDKTVLRDNN